MLEKSSDSININSGLLVLCDQLYWYSKLVIAAGMWLGEVKTEKLFLTVACWVWAWSHLPEISETRREAETEGGPLGRPPVVTVHLLRLELIKGERLDFLGCPAQRPLTWTDFSSVFGLLASEGKSLFALIFYMEGEVHDCDIAAERDSVPCLGAI